MGEIFQPVLPPEVRIGTGQMVTVTGELSTQIDLLLYSPSVMMPAALKETGYYPIESVLYSIEVKTTLDSGALRQTIESAGANARLPLIETEHWDATGDSRIVASRRFGTPLPIFALFAFGSDLASDPGEELARYRRLDTEADTKPAVGVICICGRGYWYFDKRWKFSPATVDADEVLTFLAGMVNTIPQLVVAKGHPRFGQYLSPGSSIVDAT